MNHSITTFKNFITVLKEQGKITEATKDVIFNLLMNKQNNKKNKLRNFFARETLYILDEIEPFKEFLNDIHIQKSVNEVESMKKLFSLYENFVQENGYQPKENLLSKVDLILQQKSLSNEFVEFNRSHWDTVISKSLGKEITTFYDSLRAVVWFFVGLFGTGNQLDTEERENLTYMFMNIKNQYTGLHYESIIKETDYSKQSKLLAAHYQFQNLQHSYTKKMIGKVDEYLRKILSQIPIHVDGLEDRQNQLNKFIDEIKIYQYLLSKEQQNLPNDLSKKLTGSTKALATTGRDIRVMATLRTYITDLIEKNTLLGKQHSSLQSLQQICNEINTDKVLSGYEDIQTVLNEFKQIMDQGFDGNDLSSILKEIQEKKDGNGAKISETLHITNPGDHVYDLGKEILTEAENTITQHTYLKKKHPLHEYSYRALSQSFKAYKLAKTLKKAHSDSLNQDLKDIDTLENLKKLESIINVTTDIQTAHTEIIKQINSSKKGVKNFRKTKEFSESLTSEKNERTQEIKDLKQHITKAKERINQAKQEFLSERNDGYDFCIRTIDEFIQLGSIQELYQVFRTITKLYRTDTKAFLTSKERTDLTTQRQELDSLYPLSRKILAEDTPRTFDTPLDVLLAEQFISFHALKHSGGETPTYLLENQGMVYTFSKDGYTFEDASDANIPRSRLIPLLRIDIINKETENGQRILHQQEYAAKKILEFFMGTGLISNPQKEIFIHVYNRLLTEEIAPQIKQHIKDELEYDRRIQYCKNWFCDRT